MIRLTSPVLDPALQIRQLSNVPATPRLISQLAIIDREETEPVAHKYLQSVQVQLLSVLPNWLGDPSLDQMTAAFGRSLGGETAGETSSCGHLLR